MHLQYTILYRVTAAMVTVAWQSARNVEKRGLDFTQVITRVIPISYS